MSAGPRDGRDMRCAINGRFLGVSQTGVQRVAHEIGIALAAMTARGDPVIAGLQFEIWVPPALGDAAKAIGLPVRTVGKGGGNAWEQAALAFHEPDVTLLNLCNMGPVLRRNAITMIHDAQVFQSPASYRWAFRVWYQNAQRWIGRRHRAILTVSDFSADELIRHHVIDRDAMTVHNGSDHVFRNAADTGPLVRLGLAPRSYVVALASTLAHKNIAMLLRAFADPTLRDIRLVLYGSTPRSAFEQAGTPVPSNVLFAGRVDDAELRGLVENALCLAFPSRTEGFGLPPLEAMQLGCPVIVAPNGALPEVCGKAALYADADDAAMWVDRISALANDPALWHEREQAGKAQAHSFTWERAALAIAGVLRQSAGRSIAP